MQVVVGRIGKPQGVRGEVTVEVRTDDPDDRFTVGRRLGTEPASDRELVVAASRRHGRGWVLAFEGVTDRTAAEALRDTLLAVDTADLPPLADPEEFYDHQLEGLAAVLTDGRAIGVVREVLHLPGGDVLAVDLHSSPGRSTGPHAGAPDGAGTAADSDAADPEAAAADPDAADPEAAAADPEAAAADPDAADPDAAPADPDAAGEVLVPFVAAIVPVVDLEAGRVVIDPPPGLLDPEPASAG